MTLRTKTSEKIRKSEVESENKAIKLMNQQYRIEKDILHIQIINQDEKNTTPVPQTSNLW